MDQSPEKLPDNSELDSPSSTETTPASRRSWSARPMRWLRRLHMYLALFMFPWVFLYGITGFLFNHPNTLPDHDIRKLDSQELQGIFLDSLPEPEQAATAVLNRIEEEKGTAMSEYKLINPESARYRHEAIFDVTDKGKKYTLVVHPSQDTGRLHTRSVEPPRITPLKGIWSLNLNDSTRADLRSSAVEVLEKMDISTNNMNMRWGPQLEFEMAKGDEVWVVSYNVSNRNISAKPKDGWPGPKSARQYLARLHFSHTYPKELGARTLWALSVDATAIGLILWGLTGFLMWWQRKRIRLSGMIVIAISVIWACGLGYMMYQAFG